MNANLDSLLESLRETTDVMEVERDDVGDTVHIRVRTNATAATRVWNAARTNAALQCGFVVTKITNWETSTDVRLERFTLGMDDNGQVSVTL